MKKTLAGLIGAASALSLTAAIAQEPEGVAAPDAAVAQESEAAAAPEAPPASEPEATATQAEPATTAEGNVNTETGQKYLGVMGTYGLPDNGRSKSGADIDFSGGVDAFYGWQGAKRWGFEVHGFYETLETDKPLRTDFYRYGGNLDLFYAFGDRLGFTPFVLIGVGGNEDDVFPGKDDFNIFGNAGVGFVTDPLFDEYGNVRLRGEARYVYDDFESGYDDIRFGLGLEIALFREAPPPPPAPPAEPVTVVETIVKEVPTGVLDSDNDGVVDESDKCPNTPANTRVDGVGCPLEKIIKLEGVTFEFDKTRLRPDAQTILQFAVDILKKYPDMNVEVAGHTDSKGSDAYNQKLSEGRAASVREFFVSNGIPGGQMTLKGYGEAEPVDTNDTDAGRERNRRVELRILN